MIASSYGWEYRENKEKSVWPLGFNFLFFRALNVLWLLTSSFLGHDHTIMVDYTLKWWTKINPLFLNLLLLRCFITAMRQQLLRATISWCSILPYLRKSSFVILVFNVILHPLLSSSKLIWIVWLGCFHGIYSTVCPLPLQEGENRVHPNGRSRNGKPSDRTWQMPCPKWSLSFYSFHLSPPHMPATLKTLFILHYWLSSYNFAVTCLFDAHRMKWNTELSTIVFNVLTTIVIQLGRCLQFRRKCTKINTEEWWASLFFTTAF